MAMELPEALVIAQQMNEVLPGKRIAEVAQGDNLASLIRQTFSNLDRIDLTGTQVIRAVTRGRWLCLELEPALALLITLETSGQIRFHETAESLPPKYTLKLAFHDDTFLTVRTVGWGFLQAVPAERLPGHFYWGAQGISPLDEAFTFDRFCAMVEERAKLPLKRLLLDHTGIAGIGNGYAQEIAWRARLHPARKAATLTAEERQRLYQTIRSVMEEALRLGGSEPDLYGRPGAFVKTLGQHVLNMPCPECGTPIEKLQLFGSAAYLCTRCQHA